MDSKKEISLSYYSYFTLFLLNQIAIAFFRHVNFHPSSLLDRFALRSIIINGVTARPRRVD